MLSATKTKQETSHHTCLLITFVGLGDGQELWVVQWSCSTGGEFKWLRAQRVKELFGLEVYNSCRCRQGEILDVTTAARWGLTEEIRLEEKNAMTVENGVDMMVAIDKVLYNHSTASPDLSLPDGLRYRDLQPGCYYGAASESSEWHLVLLFTAKIGHAGGASSSKARAQGKSNAENLSEPDKWCVRHPGSVYRAPASPGKRSSQRLRAKNRGNSSN